MAECSTSRNVVNQLKSHVEADRSLQRDRIIAGPGLPGQTLRSTPQEMAAQDKAMMEQFMQGDIPQDAFAMEAMRAELQHIHHGPSPGPQIMSPPPPQVGQAGWANEFHVASPAPQVGAEGFSADEFRAFNGGQTVQSPPAATHTHAHAHQHQHQPQRAYFRPTGYSMMGGLRMQPGYTGQAMMNRNVNAEAATAVDKGKGKMVEIDDAAWSEAEALAKELTEEEQQKAIEQELNAQGETMFGDFGEVWANMKEGELENEEFDVNWLEEFDSTKTWTPQDSMTTTLPNMGEYMFEPENPYLDTKDPFTEGKRLMENGGNLSLAALAFEAAVQNQPNHVEAWTLLGAAQAQNEKETPAIRALETATRLDEKNLRALMDLAVSYTNEGYDSSAYATLEKWLLTKYPQLAPETPAVDTDRANVHERVTDLFIRAAQLSPDGQVVDSDVQVGLGVLFYGAEEYDKAVDCFSVALQFDYDARDKNHLLWNRLGATLANSGRPEDAINAYEKALEINPNFVRARYNLGVSCINIGCYPEAAQHLLRALSMHKVARDKASEAARDLGIDPGRILQNESTNLLDTLRRVFGQMGRRDLAEKVVAGMDVDQFRGEFDF